MIIDIHTHTFPEKIAAKAMEVLCEEGDCVAFTAGTDKALTESMKEAGIDYSVTLTVMTNALQVSKLNSGFIKEKEELYKDGIIVFGGIHPDFEDYKNELKRLKDNGILGIKLHPAYQNTDLDDIKMMRIIDCASELDLLTMVHGGIEIAFPEHNYSSVAQIEKVLREVQPEKMVIAHMGGWKCWDEVEKYLCGAPVYFDTGFSMRPQNSIKDWQNAEQFMHNLTDESFVRIAKKHGTEKILFASDCPWNDQKDCVEILKKMDFTEEEKNQILGLNSAKLLGLL